jgi:hypothetical protein
MSICLRLGRLSKGSVQFRGFFWSYVTSLFFYGEELLAPRQTPNLEYHPYRLSAIAFSIYLQLPSVSGGDILHAQPENAPCRGDKNPPNMD